MFPVSKGHPVLPVYSYDHLAMSNCPRWYGKQQQQKSFCCQNMLILQKKTVGTYKELRKKKIQLQKDASNFFYYPCRRAQAFRSRTAADTTFFISSSACNLAHKVPKYHFRVLQKENCLQFPASNTKESSLPHKINFYIVTYMLTSLIGNEDKIIERKHTLQIHTCIYPARPEHAGII